MEKMAIATWAFIQNHAEDALLGLWLFLTIRIAYEAGVYLGTKRQQKRQNRVKVLFYEYQTLDSKLLDFCQCMRNKLDEMAKYPLTTKADYDEMMPFDQWHRDMRPDGNPDNFEQQAREASLKCRRPG